MIDITLLDLVLKGFALLALASIAIGVVHWLIRTPTLLMLALTLLGVSALLAH
jgi:hypothetical protein